MRLGLALLAFALALPAAAETPANDPPLSAKAFDALTRGKTMDTHDAELGLYGVETFLSGQRVIWRDSDRCIHGTWEQVGAQICFQYEDKPDDPVCWSYHDRGGWIMGWFQGDRTTVPIMLYPSKDGPIGCEGFLGV
ncbi:hypothetical protein LHP98_11045 [Rhodobacter sp. Har01]|uniref:hypothetical protein n=1 Tax=Rhodobacter sp. Har01 TaxID=2883999 RepID=UPI001D07AB0C|nr:hypothetical protein [Rhodobacter sp. Har01]MCB6178664.1 hypothetical protein [Rhodobacter sp. Har01]